MPAPPARPRVSELVEVREGAARLRIPAAERAERGPASKDAAPVFFNPAMALNRDLSSLLVATRAREGWHALDGLAASGARGIRYALEAGVPLHVEWNDWNPVAVRRIEENARLNGLEPHVTRRSLAALLHEKVWHVVDLDPYGSPAPFLDGAARAVRDGGILGVTATDTMALAGVYPKAARRRYLATPMHGELGHEVALRVLAGAVVRHAAKHDMGYRPLLAHATDHYYRVALVARRGASRADDALRSVGHVFLCRACGERGVGEPRGCPACGGPVELAGPLWTGPLVDADAARAMLSRADAGHPLARPDDARRLLALLAQEAEAPPLFHDLHEAGSRAGVGSPPMQAVLDELRARGHGAWPVHFNRLAVRTHASAREVAEVVRDKYAG